MRVPGASAKDYTKKRERNPRYAPEFISGAPDFPTFIAGALTDARQKHGNKAPDEVLLGGVRAYMMTKFGWSQGDCDQYLKQGAKGKPVVAQTPRVAALDEEGRQAFELFGGSPLTQGSSPKPFDTADMFSKFMGSGYSIYVMDKAGRIFAAQHKVGIFHHSSFLSGGSVAGAGEMKVDHGSIQSVTNKSGHYTPTDEEMLQVFEELQSRGVNLSSVEYRRVGKRFRDKPRPYPGSAAQFVKDQTAGVGQEQA